MELATHSILRSILVDKPTACELARTSLPIVRPSILPEETRNAASFDGKTRWFSRLTIEYRYPLRVLMNLISISRMRYRIINASRYPPEKRSSIGPRRACKLRYQALFSSLIILPDKISASIRIFWIAYIYL